jgi:Curlin associated repeat
MSRSFKSTLIALSLASFGMTALPTIAEANGQISIGINADKNTDAGKALTIFNTVIANAPLGGGNGNHGKIKQHGKKNSAGLKQKGHGNGAGIFQDCNGCSTSVAQNGNNNSQSVLQFGKGAKSKVNQTGNNQAGTQIDFGF